jgi:thiamine pyrophosphokinase
MKALIACSGEIKDYSFCSKHIEDIDYIIGVDGGAHHLLKLGLKPDVLLGDFDSILESDLVHFKHEGIEILKYPSEKDLTDSELAVEAAIEKGCDTVVMIGCVGSRLDHSIANIHLLKKLLDNGIKGIIVNENNEITLIRDHLELKREEDTRVSLLPLTGKVTGITLKGFYYPLNDFTLELGSARCVSNEFAEDTAEITIKDGLLLVVKSRD